MTDEEFARHKQDLGDEDWEIRRETVRTLGDSKDVRAIPLIRQALNDPNSEVGVASVTALGQLAREEVVPDLEAELRDYFRNRRRRREAILGLAKLDHPRVLEILRGVLAGRDHFVKDAVITALLRFGEQAIPILRQRLKAEQDIALRLLTAFGLLQLGDRSGLPVLVEVLEDHVAEPGRWDPKAIAAVAASAAEHGVVEALPALSQLCEDDDFGQAFPGLARRAILMLEDTKP